MIKIVIDGNALEDILSNIERNMVEATVRIDLLEKDLVSSNDKINRQEAEISDLKTKIIEINTNIIDMQSEELKDSRTFFGKLLDKLLCRDKDREQTKRIKETTINID